MKHSSERKLGVAILGSGNIATDLLYKVARSHVLEVKIIAGIDPSSDGLKRAQEMGFATSGNGIEAVLRTPGIKLVFDATSARAHLAHAPRLETAGIVTIDLTPAAVGPGIVPSVNMHKRLANANVNMVSCGAQATVPIVAAINRVCPVQYAETVSTIASLSAGPGTRQNIDEFTRATSRSLVDIGGAKSSKSIVVLNPADPPIMMRNTVYAVLEKQMATHEPDIHASVMRMAETVRALVPGYRITVEPLFEGNQITTSIEVEGIGDYLPKYAGNLDIITSASVGVAERYANSLH